MTFDDLLQKKIELDALISQYGEQALKALLNEFMESFPFVQALGWYQYTPYFNDGEPCVFGVSDVLIRIPPEILAAYKQTSPWFSIQDYIDHPNDLEVGFINAWMMLDTDLKTALTALSAKVITNKQLMLSAFGDHTMIIVTPTEINVSEFDHE